MMPSVKQDPQKLRELSDKLSRHIGSLDTALSRLGREVVRLGATWQDQEYRDFCREAEALKRSLDNYGRDMRQVHSELLLDAEKLEAYQRHEMGGR